VFFFCPPLERLFSFAQGGVVGCFLPFPDLFRFFLRRCSSRSVVEAVCSVLRCPYSEFSVPFFLFSSSLFWISSLHSPSLSWRRASVFASRWIWPFLVSAFFTFLSHFFPLFSTSSSRSGYITFPFTFRTGLRSALFLLLRSPL